MSDKYQVTASSLNVRDKASVTGVVIGYLQKGDVVNFIRTSGDGYWLRVRKGELEGWASHKYLLKAEANQTNEVFPWMAIAKAEIGVKEFPGNGDNPRVVAYLKSTNLSAPSVANDETPWCSGFANWCVERAGFEGTDSAWARSWLNWGKKTTTPKRGCVVVFSRGEAGHVAFFVEETARGIKVLGGNQNDEVNESVYDKSRLLGYRLPG